MSLFSGCGGLDIGAHLAGFTTEVAIELEPVFCDSLKANQFLSRCEMSQFDDWFVNFVSGMGRPESKQIELTRKRLLSGVGRPNAMSGCKVISADVGRVGADDIIPLVGEPGTLELVLGGPPCQSFSQAGKRGGLEDSRGRLFLDFVRFVDSLRPRFFLFENVKGLTHLMGPVVKSYCAECGEFQPRFGELIASDEVSCPRCGRLCENTGATINRKTGTLEIIVNEFQLIGYTIHTVMLNAADFGAPQNRERLFIVGSRDGEKFVPPASSHFSQTEPAHLFDRQDLLPYNTVWETLFSEPNPYHPWPLDSEEAVLWVKNVVRPHAEPVTWSLNQPSPTVGAHQAAKLAIAPHGIPAEQLARQQWHTRGNRQGLTKPIAVEHSMLSDEDLLSLQTFPRDWVLSGTSQMRKFQVGNAVPPILAAAVIGALPL